MHLVIVFTIVIIYVWFLVVCEHIYLYWLKHCNAYRFQQHIESMHAYKGLTIGNTYEKIIKYDIKTTFISRLSLRIFFVLSLILLVSFALVPMRRSHVLTPYIFLLMWGAYFCIAWFGRYFKLLKVRIEDKIARSEGQRGSGESRVDGQKSNGDG